MMFDSKEVVTVVTNLDKRDIEKQQQSIATWQKSGFSVVSVNSEADVNILGGYFPGVAFVIDKSAKRDPSGLFHVQFDALLGVLRQSKGRIGGIVKSGVVFTENIAPVLKRETAGAVVYGTQITQEQLNSPHEELGRWGFDFVFVDKMKNLEYPASQFLVGLRWWDCWALLLPIMGNQPVKRVGSAGPVYQTGGAASDSNYGFVELGSLLAQMVRAKVPVEGRNALEYYRNIVRYIFEKSIEIE